MKQKILISVLIIMTQFVIVYNLKCQNSFNYEICLKEVSFGGENHRNFIRIRKDDNSEYFSPPHYSRSQCFNRPVVKPIAYVSGTSPKVQGTIQIKNCINPIWISIKAVSTNPNLQSHYYPAKLITPLNDLYYYKEANGSFVTAINFDQTTFTFENNKVLYEENYKLIWRIYPNSSSLPNLNDENWKEIETITNPLYVTYKQPKIRNTNAGYDYFHTLLYQSCKSASGLSNDNGIALNIWNEIKEKNVEKADNSNNLFYYRNWNITSTVTSELLQEEDGQCGSWVCFLIDLFKIQGIAYSDEEDDYYIVQPLYHEMLINNWSINGLDLFTFDQNYPLVQIPHQNSNSNLEIFQNQSGEFYYSYIYSEIDDNSGLSGQGESLNPSSIFQNHQFAKYENIFYDASYGKTYNNLDDFRNQIFGYRESLIKEINELNYDINNDGMPDDLNGDGVISTNATTLIYQITTDKNLFDLERNTTIVNR